MPVSEGGSARRDLLLGVAGRALERLRDQVGSALVSIDHPQIPRAELTRGDRIFLAAFSSGRKLELLAALCVATVDGSVATGEAPFSRCESGVVVPHGQARLLSSPAGERLRFARAEAYELHPRALLRAVELDEASGRALSSLLSHAELGSAPSAAESETLIAAPAASPPGPAPPGARLGGPGRERSARRTAGVLRRAGMRTLEQLRGGARDRLSATSTGASAPKDIDDAGGTAGGPAPASFAAPDVASTELRDVQIAEERRAGATLQEIASRHGITRERVRQIAKQHDVAAVEAAGARTAADLDAAMVAVDAVRKRFRAGVATGDISRELGLKGATVREVLRRSATQSDRAARAANSARTPSAAARRVPDETLLDAIRDAGKAASRSPSAGDYRRIADQRGLPGPQTVAKRFGSWREAVAAAGLAPREGKFGTSRRWTEQRCWEATLRLAGELGRWPPAAEYDRLARSRDDLPSTATLRMRLGLWSAIAVRVHEHLAPESEQP